MKPICSTRRLVRTALLFASTAAGLLAQSEMASNAMPHETIPFANLPTQNQNDSIGNLNSKVGLDTHLLPPSFDVASPTQRATAVPGTLATDSASPLTPAHKSAIRVEPDYLPSWITNQPLAYLRYGAAPAVVTLHFGHN
jgi:hypothetical protein